MKPWRARRRAFEFKGGKYQRVILEEDIVKEIITRLWWAKIKVWQVRERIPGMSKKLSTPGIPDLIGWVPMLGEKERSEKALSSRHFGGLPLFIEVKRPGGVHRTAQTQFIDEARKDGCIAFFAESWDDVVREFAQCGIDLKYDVGEGLK